MEMPGRVWKASDYRYSMNTQEHDDEIFKGAMHAQFWEYDSRIGRRWNLDPKGDFGISDYACLGNNPIQLSDPFGDDVDVGKKKQRIDESQKKKIGKTYTQGTMDIEDQAKKKENNGKEEIEVGYNMKDLSMKTVYEVDGKKVSEKEYNKAIDYNNKIDLKNQEIDAHNSLIDKKIDFFKSAGFDVKYNPETGKITNATHPNKDNLMPYQRTLFETVNSSETYKFNVGGGKVFSFDGKNSFTMSKSALYSGSRSALHKIVAGDAGHFLGKGGSAQGAIFYLGKTAPGGNQSIKFSDRGYMIESKIGSKTVWKAYDIK